jgi:outer membrane protein assembly factor BamE (lipoprotein component of BamABCDE complex)
LDQTSSEIILGKPYTSKELFDEIIWYYKKAYDMGNVQAWLDLIEFWHYYSAYERKEYITLCIDIWENLLTTHLADMEQQVIGNLCNRLWSFYYATGNREKWNIYFAMSDDYWWAYPYFY